MKPSTVEQVTKVPGAYEARVAIEEVLNATEATAINDGRLPQHGVVEAAVQEEKVRFTKSLLETIENQLIARVIPGVNQQRDYIDRFRNLDEGTQKFRARIQAIEAYLLQQHNQKYPGTTLQELPDSHVTRTIENAKRFLAAEDYLYKSCPTADAWVNGWDTIEANQKKYDETLKANSAAYGDDHRPFSPWTDAFELLYKSLKLKTPFSLPSEWGSWPPAAIMVRKRITFTRYLLVGLYLYGTEDPAIRNALKAYIAK
ncbi:hypothetical protein KA517_01700 [Candidatus Gracilibacteria bacterium]|nr:hypothetical protein [Candidatus Gracilibacteria bacterium]